MTDKSNKEIQLSRYMVESGFAKLLCKFLALRHIKDDFLAQEIAKCSGKQRFSMGQWWEMLEHTASLCPEQALGLRIGELFEPSHAGVLGYLSSSSRNVGEALFNFERFQQLVYGGNPCQLKVDADSFSLEWGTALGVANQLVDETGLAALVSLMRKVTNHPELGPSRIGFINPKPKNPQPYEDFFNCTVVFEAPVTSVQFPTSYLKVAIVSQDSNLHHLLTNQAAEMLAKQPSQNEFQQQLQEVILRALHSGQVNFEHVAEQMHTSPRTLHRRLAEQELEFKTLLLNMRKQLAQQYLADPQLSLTEISLLLGYSESSAFSRAFKTWFNQTPKQFRHNQ